MSLSPEHRELLLAKCTPVVLPLKSTLFEPHSRSKHAYFLTSGVCSSVTMTAAGESAEVGVIGNEGVVGGLLLLGPARNATQGIVQSAATGYRISMRELQGLFRASEEIRGRLLEFVQSEALMANQLAGCHRLHETEQRLARWLLMMQDRVGSSDLKMTHSFLGLLIGAHRPTITLVARSMQKRGLLKLQRGYVGVANRAELERTACECYDAIRQLSQSLYMQPLSFEAEASVARR